TAPAATNPRSGGAPRHPGARASGQPPATTATSPNTRPAPTPAPCHRRAPAPCFRSAIGLARRPNTRRARRATAPHARTEDERLLCFLNQMGARMTDLRAPWVISFRLVHAFTRGYGGL